jgi:hypothetical protein
LVGARAEIGERRHADRVFEQFCAREGAATNAIRTQA